MPEKIQIRIREQLRDFSTPWVMGILNFTPDSFYDGGRYDTDSQLLEHTEKMLKEGADVIDVGAVSTRPGAADIPVEEERGKIEHLLSLLRKEFPEAVVSVDTWRAEVAESAILAGADIINDVSGGTFDARMAEVVGRYQVPYILMHTTAKPNCMQQQVMGENPLAEMMQFFGNQIDIFKKAGCEDIILDPGFGFGKTLEQNYLLLHNLHAFKVFEMPILVGISRKSMIYKLLETTPEHSLNGTTVLNTLALLQGANILRVHDVREAVETVKIVMK